MKKLDGVGSVARFIPRRNRIQFFNKCGKLLAAHLLPVHPGKHWHVPSVRLQLAPFMQSHFCSQLIPNWPNGQAERKILKRI